jgi:hypothetical protein
MNGTNEEVRKVARVVDFLGSCGYTVSQLEGCFFGKSADEHLPRLDKFLKKDVKGSDDQNEGFPGARSGND